jgi:hypothetical protein
MNEVPHLLVLSSPLRYFHAACPLVLLLQVESLLAERQHLSCRVHGLQKDNDQLAELVGRMARTLQVGRIAACTDAERVSHPCRECVLIACLAATAHVCAASLTEDACRFAIASTQALPATTPAQPAASDPWLTPCCSITPLADRPAAGRPVASPPQEQELQIQQLQQQHRSGVYLGPLPSLSLPPAVSTAAPAPVGLQQHLQRQRRVDEWLGRRQETWQEWQERLPLEHMHSGSSSTLTVALDQP